jgi:hypothetical protein
MSGDAKPGVRGHSHVVIGSPAPPPEVPEEEEESPEVEEDTEEE